MHERPSGATLPLTVLHSGVPTARPRHYVTESDELAAALDAAAARWPGVPRSQLLVRLALMASDAEEQITRSHRDRRRQAVNRHAGALTGVYEDGYLHTLREDWPA